MKLTSSEYQELKAVVDAFTREARTIIDEYEDQCDIGDLDSMHTLLCNIRDKAIAAEKAASKMMEQDS